MKTQIGTLTASRTNGDQHEVIVYANQNGRYFGEIADVHVALVTENGRPAVKMTAAETKSILGIDTPNGGAMYLTSDWKPMIAAWKASQAEIAMQASITGYVFRLGCDAGDQAYFVYDFPKGLSDDSRWERTKSDEKLASVLSLAELNEIAARLGAKSLQGDGSSYYGWEFDASNIAELLAAMNEKLAAREAAKKEKEDAKAANESEKFAEAARTGNAVIIVSSMVPCNSRDEDCDHDTLTTYAMPDGTKKIVRAHAH